MHNLKLMQELTFAVNIECLQSNLLAKLLMHKYARAKHSKHVNIAYKGFSRSVEWKISAYDAQIQQQYVHICHMSDFSKSMKC